MHLAEAGTGCGLLVERGELVAPAGAELFTEDLLEKGVGRIEKSLARAVEKTGALTPVVRATLGEGDGVRRSLTRMVLPTATFAPGFAPVRVAAVISKREAMRLLP